jgi:hypothetical protein
MSIYLKYNLFSSGWSECMINIDEQNVTITASYLDDALGSLASAVVRIVEGISDSTASFAEEPGEYRWRFFKKEPDRLIVRIIQFDELWGHKPDEQGKVIFEAKCRLRTFAGAVVSMLQSVLNNYGIDGYKDKWAAHDFPLMTYNRLIETLEKSK